MASVALCFSPRLPLALASRRICCGRSYITLSSLCAGGTRLTPNTRLFRTTSIWKEASTSSTTSNSTSSSSFPKASDTVVESEIQPKAIPSSQTISQDSVYHGPLSDTFRRLKIFSLSSLTLSFIFTPFLFIVESNASLPLIARFALAGIALSTRGISTFLVAWCGRPYVTTLRWLSEPNGQDAPSQTPPGLEMTTLTLGLHPRITRVYDTAFLVPTSRPFAKWELAEAFKLSPAEVEAERAKGALPREETIAETTDKSGGVIGRWIVSWDERGEGTCQEVGQVSRYFNVHEELLDRPLR